VYTGGRVVCESSKLSMSTVIPDTRDYRMVKVLD
jgi:hypothetical protein